MKKEQFSKRWHVFLYLTQTKEDCSENIGKEGGNMQAFYIAAAGILGLLIGFWSGRSLQWKIEETEENAEEEHEERKRTEDRQFVMQGTVIGSPVSGEIRNSTEANTPESKSAEETEGKVCIVPEEGKVYAPAAGKILKLYPMGNRIRFCTDSGIELLLDVCRDREGLHSAFYHCNVLQNEVVRKGKLLLEFDKDSLAGEGVDTAVTVELCTALESGRIVSTWKDHIHAGEDLLWVQRRGKNSRI